MENRRYKLSFVFAFLLLVLSAVIYAAKIRFEFDNKVNFIIYGLVFLMLIILAYQSFKEKSYPSALEIKKIKSVSDSAFLAGIGFLIDFISCSMSLYTALNSKRIIYAKAGANAVSLVFALLSSLYFISIFLSYRYSSYDFRKLKFLHFSPLLWALFRSGDIILNVVTFKEDVFSTTKGLMLIFAILFFFSFISEIENEKGAKRSFVFFVGAFSYLCLLIFSLRFFELRFRKAELLSEDSFFAVTSLCLFSFAHYFRNNLLSPRL
ncbi:MAG: hypothetical protein IJR70_03455 [Eubacterium sp.]|nr:hypothetical protein [Eubacterium sp.]